MLHLKNIFRSGHGIHMPDRHHMAVKLEHLVHDESFWATAVALALIAIFIAVAVWATLTSQQSPRIMPTPYYPYGF
ncbi:MAG: hypothetical protein KAS96_02635 [Planctomycetes bacterium]|nr:hypothetical protein [Planctomycetota bacterium]